MKENNYHHINYTEIFINNIKIFIIPAIILILLAVAPATIEWKKVQQLKVRYLSQASQNAMEQQKTSQSPAIAVKMDGNAIAVGEVNITYSQNGTLLLDLNAAPRGTGPASEKVQIKLAKPVDMLTGYSGLAVFVKNEGNTSDEVRAGIILTNTEGMKTEVRPVLPVLSAWGDELHELYFDWGSLNYDKAEESARVLKSVSTIEFTFASARRAPERHGSAGPRHARFSLSNLRLVDYIAGSYDPSRQSLTFDSDAGKWVPDSRYDFTLQHRAQEVTGIVAAFGGEQGINSAIASLDMAIRTQCWDGSFLDGRRGAITVASGEYTFGFTIYGLLQGYKHMEEIKHPGLDEVITIGPTSMTRREFCQRMFYRAAMSRTAATPTYYRDDIIGGNTLISGANRVLGYAIAMRMVADVIKNPEWKKEVIDMYNPIMQEIVDAQGKYSGGFPLLGEGNRYQGRGIHYDAGYTRTHMDWLVIGALQTGDPLMVEILRKYQTVFEAAMNEQGVGIFRMVSERGTGTSPVSLVIPDATYQVGVKYNLPVIAQWGFNSSQRAWGANPGNHFTFASGARGYSLGAHTSILQDDMLEKPVPKDMGYLFPRQFPLWSTQIYSKEGELLRTSVMNFQTDGTQVSDYHIGIGEYPQTIGVPVMIKSTGNVKAIAKNLSGWPKLLPKRAKIQITGGVNANGITGKPFTVTLEKETTFIVKGPDTKLPAELGGEKKPFLAEFTLTPEKAGQRVEITILGGTIPYTYKLETR